jgi:hypothetical protein
MLHIVFNICGFRGQLFKTYWSHTMQVYSHVRTEVVHAHMYYLWFHDRLWAVQAQIPPPINEIDNLLIRSLERLCQLHDHYHPLSAIKVLEEGILHSFPSSDGTRYQLAIPSESRARQRLHKLS